MKLSNVRLAIVLVLFCLTFLGLRTTQSVREIPIDRPLKQFPLSIGKWRFINENFFSAPVIEMLGVDDYISYNYGKADGMILNLYVSYFGAVGVSGSYHSPQHCLPGGGWTMTSIEDVKVGNLSGPQKDGTIKKVIIQKDSDRQVVLYWFQNRGRIISSEYWEKIYLVLDALFKRRRDGSFIRIIGQIPEGADERQVSRDMLEFAGRTINLAAQFIPGARSE